MSQHKLFPVTVGGSWTHPEWLVQALRRRQADEISAVDGAPVTQTVARPTQILTEFEKV